MNLPSPAARGRATPPARLRGLVILLLALAVLPALSGCSSIETQHRDWSTYDGAGAEWFEYEDPTFPKLLEDSGEPFNRGMARVNHWLMVGLVDPIGRGWRFVFPKAFRQRLGMAGTNLAFPVRAVNNLFQGEFSSAGIETVRFVINFTVGLLGFFDPADSWGIEAPRPTDTGLTLEKAGWEEPEYLFLPAWGPSSTRDGVGAVGNLLLNPAWWIGGVVPWVFAFNTGSDTVLTYNKLQATENDPYIMMRLGWTILRTNEAEQYSYDPGADSERETLKSVFAAPQNPEFDREAKHRTVELPGGRDLPYSVWMQDEPAPIFYILPGLGSHRLSNHALVLAEMAWRHGCSAVTISNALNWEFIKEGSSVPLPGYAPFDAKDAHEAFDAIDRELRDKYEDRLQERVLIGISMGGFHTMYIAARESDPENEYMPFDLYAAGAVPVRLKYGVEELDSFYRVPMEWPAEERDSRIKALLQKVVDVGRKAVSVDGLEPGGELPFSEAEAKYLIGLSFRITLINLLWTSQQKEDRGVLLTERNTSDRSPAYREMSQYSFMEYFYAFVLPWLMEDHGVQGEDEAWYHSSLQSIEPALRANDKIRVFVTDNDFLRTAGDLQFLQDLVDEGRIRVGEGGGHLGNAYRTDLQDEVMTDLLDELALRRTQD